MVFLRSCRPGTDILPMSQKDVLASTLASGVQVKRYVPSYGGLPNEITEVTKCRLISSVHDQFQLTCALQISRTNLNLTTYEWQFLLSSIHSAYSFICIETPLTSCKTVYGLRDFCNSRFFSSRSGAVGE
jgi:hypothetical protein